MAHGEDAVPDPIRRQVAEHVAATVRNARIPAAERDDVAEELAAHLGEAYRANVAQGMPPDDAMHHALAAFGRAELLSREFMVTYRGRLWAPCHNTCEGDYAVIGLVGSLNFRTHLHACTPVFWRAQFRHLIQHAASPR